jgi:hypothetical protein
VWRSWRACLPCKLLVLAEHTCGNVLRSLTHVAVQPQLALKGGIAAPDRYKASVKARRNTARKGLGSNNLARYDTCASAGRCHDRAYLVQSEASLHVGRHPAQLVCCHVPLGRCCWCCCQAAAAAIAAHCCQHVPAPPVTCCLACSRRQRHESTIRCTPLPLTTVPQSQKSTAERCRGRPVVMLPTSQVL